MRRRSFIGALAGVVVLPIAAMAKAASPKYKHKLGGEIVGVIIKTLSHYMN
jgi:hypothetical protein